MRHRPTIKESLSESAWAIGGEKKAASFGLNSKTVAFCQPDMFFDPAHTEELFDALKELKAHAGDNCGFMLISAENDSFINIRNDGEKSRKKLAEFLEKNEDVHAPVFYMEHEAQIAMTKIKQITKQVNVLDNDIKIFLN